VKWRKLGRVFTAEGQHDWMISHAANPVAEHRGGGEYRIYFGCRDRQNRTHIGFVDVELHPEVRVLRIADEPVVAPGPLGAFDDSGTSMGWLTQVGEATYLYYLGWNLGVTVPWRNSIGLAVRARPSEPFVKHSPAPLLDRCAVDPFTLSYPCVLRDGQRWKMWYGSNLRWGRHETDMDHVIKYAESADGLHWERNGVIALDLQPPEEYALCRPCVVKEGSLYRMWYCHRGASYRIGYAESEDGVRWRRCHDQAGIDVSPSGWDAEMVAYPFVFAHRGQRNVLYNGNGYGRTGFGLAVEEG
jgi:hypothetical protein